jgi:hypothetical protein
MFASLPRCLVLSPTVLSAAARIPIPYKPGATVSQGDFIAVAGPCKITIGLATGLQTNTFPAGFECPAAAPSVPPPLRFFRR